VIGFAWCHTALHWKKKIRRCIYMVLYQYE
jgi:hypothetical protein